MGERASIRRRAAGGAPARGAMVRRVVAGLAAASLLAAVVVLGGCGDEASGPPVYTEADNGATVRAAVGDTFTVRLAENPSTGFTWTLRPSSGLKLLGDELEQPSASPAADGPSPVLVGAPGTRVLEYEVSRTGTQLLQGVYHRTWEAKDDAGTQEFTLTVEVR